MSLRICEKCPQKFILWKYPLEFAHFEKKCPLEFTVHENSPSPISIHKLLITLLIHVHSPLQSQIPFIIGALLYKKSLDSHSSWRAKSCTILAPKIFDAFHMKKIWYFLAPNFAAQLWPNLSNTDSYLFYFHFFP